MAITTYTDVGLPDPPEPDEGVLIKTEEDLFNELGEQLPDWIYENFRKAVDVHLLGNFQDAQNLYNKLRSIPRKSGGTFDLATVSKVFQHNLNLLDITDF